MLTQGGQGGSNEVTGYETSERAAMYGGQFAGIGDKRVTVMCVVYLWRIVCVACCVDHMLMSWMKKMTSWMRSGKDERSAEQEDVGTGYEVEESCFDILAQYVMVDWMKDCEGKGDV